MLKIHEQSLASGELSGIYLRAGGAGLELVTHDQTWRLPERAFAAVMARFAAPFDAEARITVVGELVWGDGERVRHVRHLAGYDVIARDYLVYDSPTSAPCCALAATVVPPLIHLGRVAVAEYR